MVLLELRDVTYRFPRATTDIFSEVSFGVARGESIAVTGPSGSGKSTLLFILGLMLSPRQGSLVFEGISTSQLSDRERSRIRSDDIGFLFQDAQLDQRRSVRWNLVEAFAYQRRRPSADMMSQAPRLLLERLGMDIPENRRPAQISGGQAQRVALARALIKNPSLLLADEPTGNLDPASADIVLEAMLSHSHKGGASVIATHDPAVVAKCDRVIDVGVLRDHD